MKSQTGLTGQFPTSPPSDSVLAALAGRQHGLLRTPQLLAAGLTYTAIGKRVKAGRLHRRYRGVYSIGHAALSREGEFLAAVFAAGEGALLSHLATAELRGVWRYRAPLIDVVVPRKRRSEPGTRFHQSKTLHPHDRTTIKGIPVTSMARLLVDLTDVLIAHELTNVIHEAAYRGHFSLLATYDAIQRANGRHHLDVLHEAIALHLSGSAGTKSRGEVALIALITAAGLPMPLVNVHLAGHEVDTHWPDLKLAIEVDGPGHARPRTQREDAEKERAWRAAGYDVHRFGAERLPQAVELIRQRAARPARP